MDKTAVLCYVYFTKKNKQLPRDLSAKHILSANTYLTSNILHPPSLKQSATNSGKCFHTKVSLLKTSLSV